MYRARFATIRAGDVCRRRHLQGAGPLMLVVIAVAFAGCAAHRLQERQQEDDAARLARARELVHEGHYGALQQALALVQDVHGRARDRRRTADQLLGTALLVAAREKELAIVDTGALAVAEGALGDAPDAAALQAALTIVRWEPLRHRGMAGLDAQGLRDEQAFRHRFEALRAATAVVASRAGEELFDYILASEAPQLVAELRAQGVAVAPSPTSPLLLYRQAAGKDDGGSQLEQLLRQQPAFAEAHYWIGARILDRARSAADLGRAQQHLAQALEALPDSAAVRMAAADLWFVVGDWEGAIDSYDSTLGLAPTHRQALLRRAICQSLLSRPRQALAELEALDALPGGYLPGETHYWIAWNLRQLGRLAETGPHVARARQTLSGDSRVHLLAGQIAHALDEVEQAAIHFRRAIELNERECDAHAGRAAIQAARREWPSASATYERAATCQAAAVAALDEQLQELRSAALPEPLRTRVLRRRQDEREALALGRATNELNAAAAAFNAGDLRRTVELAGEASAHPLLAERARALMDKVGPAARR